MKINIVAVGKIKDEYITKAIEEYAKRISRFADFQIIELPDSAQSKSSIEQRDIESKRILEKAKGYLICLDVNGKQISSEQFAEFFDSKCVDGISEFSFLIGGSNGHSELLKKRADMLLSFGKMTFPHQFFRAMLTEQIYRALSINNNLPYHK